MKRAAAYTLIEVLVAAAILIIAVSAAAALAVATVAQEEVNSRIARCLNLHEQAVRLYQLGLEPSVITSILPEDPAVDAGQPVFTTVSLTISNLGTVEQSESTLEFTPDSSSGSTRTNTIIAIRPSIR